MQLVNKPLVLALLSCTTIFSACATRTSVVAHANPHYTPTFASPIAMPERRLNSTQETQLCEVIKAEFGRRGVQFVPPVDSEYSLAFWIEENQEQGPQMPPTVLPYNKSFISDPLLPQYGYGRSQVGMQQISMQPVESPPRDLTYTGIRLKLYVSHPANTNEIETAWDGFIDGGMRMSSEEYDRLVRTLLDYFGKDFKGRVKRVE
jgi:hypothetical protein